MYGLSAKEKAALFQSKSVDKPAPEKPAPRKIGKLNLSALKQDAIEVVKKKSKKAAGKKKKTKATESVEAMKERKAKLEEQQSEDKEPDSVTKDVSHNGDGDGVSQGAAEADSVETDHAKEETRKTDHAAEETRETSPESKLRKVEAEEAAALLALDSDEQAEGHAATEDVTKDEVKSPDGDATEPLDKSTAADGENVQELSEDVDSDQGDKKLFDEDFNEEKNVALKETDKAETTGSGDEAVQSASDKEEEEREQEKENEEEEEQAILLDDSTASIKPEKKEKKDEEEEEKEEVSFNFTVTTSQDEQAEFEVGPTEMDSDKPDEEVAIKIKAEEEEDEEKEAASEKEEDNEDKDEENDEDEEAESSATPDDTDSVIKQSSQSASESDAPSKDSAAATTTTTPTTSEVEETVPVEKPSADVVDAKISDENANGASTENAGTEKDEQPPAEYQPVTEDFYKNLFYFSGMGSVIGSALSAGVYVPADTARTGLGPEDVENLQKATYDRRAEIVSTARKQAVEVTDGLQKLQTILGGLPTFGESGQQSVSGKDGTAYIQPMTAVAAAQKSPTVEHVSRVPEKPIAVQQMPLAPTVVVAQPAAKPVFQQRAAPVAVTRAPTTRVAPTTAVNGSVTDPLPPWMSKPSSHPPAVRPAPQVAVQPVDLKPSAQKVTFSPTTPPGDDQLAVPERRRAHSVAVGNDIGRQFVPLAPREHQPKLGGARPYGVHTGIARSQSVPYQERYSGAVVENRRPDPFSPTMIDCSRVKPWQMSRIRRLETKGYQLSSQSENLGQTSLELEDVTLTSYSPYLVSAKPKTPPSTPIFAATKPISPITKPVTFVNRSRTPAASYTTPVLGGHAPVNSNVFKPRVAMHGSPIIRPMSQTNTRQRSVPYSDL